MDGTHFDRLSRLWATNRRALIRGTLAAVPLSILGDAVVAEAGRKRNRGHKHRRKGERQVTVCHNGREIRVPRYAVRALLLSGDTRGPCDVPGGGACPAHVDRCHEGQDCCTREFPLCCPSFGGTCCQNDATCCSEFKGCCGPTESCCPLGKAFPCCPDGFGCCPPGSKQVCCPPGTTCCPPDSPLPGCKDGCFAGGTDF